jgi:hypothetical protein
MEYFLVRPNPEYSDVPSLSDIHDKWNTNYFYADRSYEIPMRTVVHIRPNERIDFTDYLFRSVPLFSEKAMKVIWKFDDDYIHKELVLFDPKNGYDQMYYVPFFPRFPAETIVVPTSPSDVARMYSAERIELRVPYILPVFYIFPRGECRLFMRLDVVESLLRNGARGFLLQRANVVEEA